MLESVPKHEFCDEAVGLLVTYRCNLDCKYCYISKKRNKDMTFEMAKSILERFLIKDGGLLSITFMGGETLIAFDIIKKIVEWVVGGDWNRDYRFFGSTNGTLLNNDLKKWLDSYKSVLTLGLSYDGLPDIQKRNRGNNKIDLDFFIKTWPKQPIQMTINEESVYKMAEGVVFLLEKGAFVHPNVAFEEKEWDIAAVNEYGRQLNMLINYYRKHPERPMISQFIHNLNEYANNIDHPQKQCEICGAGNGFQVFDIDGLSYPCHILSPLVLRKENLELVNNGLISETSEFGDLDCVDCPYNTSCPTCLACNFIYRKQIQKRDKTHCRIMKKEVKAYIRKELIRLQNKEKLTSYDATLIDSIAKIMEYEKSINKHEK